MSSMGNLPPEKSLRAMPRFYFDFDGEDGDRPQDDTVELDSLDAAVVAAAASLALTAVYSGEGYAETSVTIGDRVPRVRVKLSITAETITPPVELPEN